MIGGVFDTAGAVIGCVFDTAGAVIGGVFDTAGAAGAIGDCPLTLFTAARTLSCSVRVPLIILIVSLLTWR